MKRKENGILFDRKPTETALQYFQRFREVDHMIKMMSPKNKNFFFSLDPLQMQGALIDDEQDEKVDSSLNIDANEFFQKSVDFYECVSEPMHIDHYKNKIENKEKITRLLAVEAREDLGIKISENNRFARQFFVDLSSPLEIESIYYAANIDPKLLGRVIRNLPRSFEDIKEPLKVLDYFEGENNDYFSLVVLRCFYSIQFWEKKTTHTAFGLHQREACETSVEMMSSPQNDLKNINNTAFFENYLEDIEVYFEDILEDLIKSPDLLSREQKELLIQIWKKVDAILQNALNHLPPPKEDEKENIALASSLLMTIKSHFSAHGKASGFLISKMKIISNYFLSTI